MDFTPGESVIVTEHTGNTWEGIYVSPVLYRKGACDIVQTPQLVKRIIPNYRIAPTTPSGPDFSGFSALPSARETAVGDAATEAAANTNTALATNFSQQDCLDLITSAVAWFSIDPLSVFVDAGITPAIDNDPVYRKVDWVNGLICDEADVARRPIVKSDALGTYLQYVPGKYMEVTSSPFASISPFQFTAVTVMNAVYPSDQTQRTFGLGVFDTGQANSFQQALDYSIRFDNGSKSGTLSGGRAQPVIRHTSKDTIGNLKDYINNIENINFSLLDRDFTSQNGFSWNCSKLEATFDEYDTFIFEFPLSDQQRRLLYEFIMAYRVNWGPLDYTALTNLPVGRQDAVKMAAITAANKTNISQNSAIRPQDGIGYLDEANVSSFLPGDGCIWQDTGKVAVADLNDPVGLIEAWNGTAIGQQVNITLKPIARANGVDGNTTGSVGIGDSIIDFTFDSTGLNDGEAFFVFDVNWTSSDTVGLTGDVPWDFGDSIPRYVNGTNPLMHDNLFLSARQGPTVFTNGHSPGIYNTRVDSGNNYTWEWNGATVRTGNVTRALPAAGSALFGSNDVSNRYFDGRIYAMSIGANLDSVKRNFIQNFLNEYLGLGVLP